MNMIVPNYCNISPFFIKIAMTCSKLKVVSTSYRRFLKLREICNPIITIMNPFPGGKYSEKIFKKLLSSPKKKRKWKRGKRKDIVKQYPSFKDLFFPSKDPGASFEGTQRVFRRTA